MNLTRRAAAAALVSTPFVSTVDARAEARISREPRRANRWRTEMFDAAASQAEALVRDGQTAGVALGVSGRGFRKSAYFGYADIESRRLVSRETTFRIASVTKPIVAACTLQLSELGALSLDDALSDYLPDFPHADEITLRQLLNHTSGVGNWWGRLPADAPADFLNSGDAHRWLARMDPVFDFAPGTLRSYSNSGYILLGEVIAKAASLQTGAAIDALVLSRVGAGASYLEGERDLRRNQAKGYAQNASGLTPVGYVSPPFTAGGMRASLHDLLAFGDALFLGPLLDTPTRTDMLAHARVADGRRVEDAMHHPEGVEPEPRPQDVSELGYGLGLNTWVQAGDRFYSHGGLIDGFGAYFLHAPRTGVTVAILSNATGGTSPLHEPIRQALIAA